MSQSLTTSSVSSISLARNSIPATLTLHPASSQSSNIVSNIVSNSEPWTWTNMSSATRHLRTTASSPSSTHLTTHSNPATEADRHSHSLHHPTTKCHSFSIRLHHYWDQQGDSSTLCLPTRSPRSDHCHPYSFSGFSWGVPILFPRDNIR